MRKLILTKLGIKTIAETLGWKIEFGTYGKEKYATFSQYSPLGEDFSFDIWYKTIDEIPKKVEEYYDDFDLDEHVKFWVSNLSHGQSEDFSMYSCEELVEDGKAIDRMIALLDESLKQGYIKEAE